MRGAPIIYSETELGFIKANCTLTRKELHRQFHATFGRPDISQSNVSSLCKRNGWLTGRTGCYEKGNIPHPHSGMKGPNSTSFKKGVMPHNWKPVGSTRISKDGYLEIKTAAPKTWTQAHILLWREQHGEIPKSHCVVFVDGDKNHIELSNLELITRTENLHINKLNCRSMPAEVQPAIRTLGKLISRIFEASNNNAEIHRG